MTLSQTKIRTWLTCGAEVSSVTLRAAAVGDAVCLVAAVAVGDARVCRYMSHSQIISQQGRTWLTRGSIVARVALAAAAVGNAVRLLGAVAVLNARKRLAAQPMVSSVAYAARRVACAVCNVTAVAVLNASIW